MQRSKLFIGRKIRDLREANRLTQARFAERIGISTSYLNQIEPRQKCRPRQPRKGSGDNG